MLREYPQEHLARLHKMELDIVLAIAEVCKKHDIAWFLCFGSALGAVRHGGFIPWDDDMDIAMMRPDYDRFLEIARTELPDDLRICIPGEEPGMAAGFAKVCKKGTRFYTQEIIDARFDQGIFVDVFCYDRISSDDALRDKQTKQTQRMKNMLFLYYSGNVNILEKQGPVVSLYQLACKVVHPIIHALYNPDNLRRTYDTYARAASNEEGTGWASFHHSTGKRIPEDVFLPLTTASFDGHELPIPGDCDRFFVFLYGESWRELPPPQQRTNHAPLVLDFGDGVNVFE